MFLGVVWGAESEKKTVFFLSFQKMSIFGQLWSFFTKNSQKCQIYWKMCVIFNLNLVLASFMFRLWVNKIMVNKGFSSSWAKPSRLAFFNFSESQKLNKVCSPKVKVVRPLKNKQSRLARKPNSLRVFRLK